jgi:hypothetical protein
MQSIACATALLLLNSAIFAQSDTAPKAVQDTEQDFGFFCPHTHVLGDGPDKYWLEGTIGNSAVKLYLADSGAGAIGLFYATDGDWTPTLLGGERSANKFKFSAVAADHTLKGRLEGQLVNGAFIGSWTSKGSDHADSVRLAAMQRPTCDGRGAWKRFDDPGWPVSFSYPASWRIKEVGDALQIICPDPEDMAYNNKLTIYEGKVQKDKPVGLWELVHCANGWRFGRSCDTSERNTASLSVLEVSQQPGRTILGIEGEWRVYCADGGYVGQGDGEDRLVLLHDSWIEFTGAGQTSDIVDRLVKSARVRTSHNAK